MLPLLEVGNQPADDVHGLTPCCLALWLVLEVLCSSIPGKVMSKILVKQAYASLHAAAALHVC